MSEPTDNDNPELKAPDSLRSISHDLNSQLTAITGNVEYAVLLLREERRDDALQVLEDAANAGAKLKGITGRLSRLAKETA